MWGEGAALVLREQQGLCPHTGPSCPPRRKNSPWSEGKGETAWRGEDIFVGSRPTALYASFSPHIALQRGCCFLFADVQVEAQRSKVSRSWLT